MCSGQKGFGTRFATIQGKSGLARWIKQIGTKNKRSGSRGRASQTDRTKPKPNLTRLIFGARIRSVSERGANPDRKHQAALSGTEAIKAPELKRFSPRLHNACNRVARFGAAFTGNVCFRY